MNISYHKPGGIHHPRQLFVLVNEFSFAIFPVRPRHLGLGQARTPQHRCRDIRLQRKGVQP